MKITRFAVFIATLTTASAAHTADAQTPSQFTEVTLDANGHETVLEREDGMTAELTLANTSVTPLGNERVRNAAALSMSMSVNWTPVCVAPCVASLHRAANYRVRSAHFSPAFVLPPGRLHMRATQGSLPMAILGGLGIGFGLVGAVTVSLAAPLVMTGRFEHDLPLEITATVLSGLGSIALTVGGWLLFQRAPVRVHDADTTRRIAARPTPRWGARGLEF